MNLDNLDNPPLKGVNPYERVLDGEISILDVPKGAGDNGHGPTGAAEGDLARRSGKIKPVPITYLPGLVEIVKDNGAPAFLMADKGVYRQLEYEGRPGIPHTDFTKLFGEPLEAEEVLGSELDPPALIRELEEFVGQHTELPEELPPLILSLWTIQGYLQESFNVLPYLYLSGPYGSGKTRVLETLAAVAFRPLFTTVLTPAAIFRTAEAWKPTFLVDESRISGNDKADLQAILNNRYKRGVAVIRCKPKSFEIQAFNVFGPTAIAGDGKANLSIPRALVTRSLSGVMATTTQPLSRWVCPEDGRPLRVKLTALRLAYYGASLPEAPRLANGRLDELVSSLHSLLLLLDPSRDQEFREAVAGQIHRYTADERDCMEAELAEALAGLEPDAEGRISVAEVVEALGWNPEDRSNTTRAGNLLRRAVGLEPVRFRREGKQYSGYIWKAERVTRFITRYYPEKGCTVAQTGAFSQVNDGVQPLCNLDFQGCTEEEVAQSECATSEGVQPLVFKVAHENTPSEQGKYEGCATVQPKTPILNITPPTNPQPQLEDSGEDSGVVVLVEKPHRIELRPRCKTLVAELAGGIYPWEYLFGDPVLAAIPLQEALYEGGWRLVVVSGDRCWMTPHEALGEAETRPHGTLVPEHLWQELGRVAS
ncbi:MAG: hypothetical protein H5T74_10410 [Actinobacteria bacterium]|nr:hypothetical protein [Actinomycetota bacterium]